MNRMIQLQDVIRQAYADNLPYRQAQAIAESLVLFLILLSLFIAIPWLGRLLDIRQQQDNASRYAAFQWTRQLNGIDEPAIKDKFFFDKAHRWQDRQGQKILREENVQLQINREQQLSNLAQAAQQVSHAQTLREQWNLQDKGIVSAVVKVLPMYSAKGKAMTGLNAEMSFLERLVIPMQRQTAILSDAGHSESDLATHQRTGQSALAWRDSAEDAYALGRHIQRYAAPVEGFHRAEPVFNWLMPWTGRLPKHHLEGGQ